MNERQSKCVHHWIIKAPEGPTSPGRCKRCRLTRAGFVNGAAGDFNPAVVRYSPESNRRTRGIELAS